MKFLICGSAASEGIPALFCECPLCRKAAGLGGRDVRSRCAYQLGKEIRFDFGPDSFHHMTRFHLDYAALTDLFLGHGHRDHLHASSLGYRTKGFARLEQSELMRLHADSEILRSVGAALMEYNTDFDRCRIDPRPLRDGEEFPLAAPGFTAKSYPARHGAYAHLFFVRKTGAGRGVFIGNDSGFFPESTWEMFSGERFGLIVLDGTYGALPTPADDCHMGLNNILDTLARMREMGVADDGSIVVANHFTHNCGMTHQELLRAFSPHGIEVGFDGMELELP